jgi:hypothetical protein
LVKKKIKKGKGEVIERIKSKQKKRRIRFPLTIFILLNKPIYSPLSFSFSFFPFSIPPSDHGR